MSTPPRRILLAEDDPHDVEMTLAALEDHTITNEIIVVSDGAEALDYLRATGRFQGRGSGHPFLVMLDLKMPQMDGLEALRAIKQDDQLRAIPVVMLTSSREEQDLVRSYQLGVNAYIVKPVGAAAFLEAVKQLGIFWALHNVPAPAPFPPASSAAAPSTP